MDVTSELATREALQDLARYARGPRGQPPACLLLYLWNEDGQYDTRYLNAGLKVSEIIALLEIVKGKFLQQINNPVEPDEDDKNEGDATN